MAKKTTKKLILLIDGENILHQSFHKFERLHSPDGRPSGAIFGFFKSLHMYIRRFNPYQVIISFDNGHSKYRDEILEGKYKMHRNNISIDIESFKKQKAVIMRVLRMLRINYIYDRYKQSNYEGDDFLAYLYLTTRKSNNYKYLLISSDKDFNQLIDKDLKIFNPRKECLVREDNCKVLFDYEPHETVEYLTLLGDKSDDIPGFPGMGPVKTRQFLDKYGKIDAALEKDSDFPRKGLLKAVWERNKQLIDLRDFISRHPDSKINNIIKFYKDKNINEKAFKRLCISYSFHSFLTIEFIKPFKDLHNEKL